MSYLKSPQDAARVRRLMSGVKGVERILTREEAAKEFKLMASRIGAPRWCFGDKDTVFGELDDAQESFPGLRSHGSLHEIDIPLFVYNAKNAPSSDYFNHNLDLARWLYQRWRGCFRGGAPSGLAFAFRRSENKGTCSEGTQGP